MSATYDLDERDRAMILDRVAAYSLRDGPRVGDFVDFTDGTTRRVSHVWAADWNEDGIARVQTSDLGGIYSGAYYLGGSGPRGGEAEAYVSYSGGLHPGIRADLLVLTDERRIGTVWVFHEDWWGAGRGVNGRAPFRVYRATVPAKR